MADRPGRHLRLEAGERGVSDVVGFVLVFGLIIGTVGAVYTTGLSGLQDARDAERLSNAEVAFDVLDSNADDVLHRGAPARATEIKLSDARIGPGDPVTVNVSAGPNASVSREITPIVYSADDTDIVYVQGAVIRSQRSGGVMLRPSGIRTGERALFPIVDTYFPVGTTVGGQTRALVRFRVPTPSDRAVRTLTTATNDTVTVTVQTSRTDPWRRHLDAYDNTTCDGDAANDTVTCEFSGVETAVVPVTTVHVRVA
ncbi:DUF7289 family protein [Halarchaeum grantii]|nr:hypothetical protein [Halarchaeum grantii]